jgi:hypothetical protein
MTEGTAPPNWPLWAADTPTKDDLFFAIRQVKATSEAAEEYEHLYNMALERRNKSIKEASAIGITQARIAKAAKLTATRINGILK